MRMQDWVFTTFLSCAVVCVVLTWAPIRRFFLSMQTGVSLVALATLAVTLGVLVPQIENFEDPDERAPELADAVAVPRPDRASEEADAPAGRHQIEVAEPHQRRLARAGRYEQNVERARLQRQGRIAEHGRGAEAETRILEFDQPGLRRLPGAVILRPGLRATTPLRGRPGAVLGMPERRR
jgi:hypothetical protein